MSPYYRKDRIYDRDYDYGPRERRSLLPSDDVDEDLRHLRALKKRKEALLLQDELDDLDRKRR